jgi:UPF0716 family protein affecting phage T7 exclusion
VERLMRRFVTEGATPLTNMVIVLAIIGSLTALVWVGKVNGDAYVSIASAVVGALLIRQGVSAGAKATSAGQTGATPTE